MEQLFWVGISLVVILLFVGVGILVGIQHFDRKDIIKEIKQKSNEDRRCPNCRRVIPFDAKICPYCGKRFEDFL